MTSTKNVAKAAVGCLLTAGLAFTGLDQGIAAAAQPMSGTLIPLVFEDGSGYRTSKPLSTLKDGNSTRLYDSYAQAAGATDYYKPYSVEVAPSATPGWLTLTSGTLCLGVRTLASFGYGSYTNEVPGLVACGASDTQRWQLNADGRLVNKSRGAVGRVFTTPNAWSGGGYHYQMGFGGAGLRLAGDVEALKPADNGGLVADDGPVTELARGAATDVPFGVRFTATANQMKGKVRLTAPQGTRFSGGQSSVSGQYQLPGASGWVDSQDLTLTDGVLSSDGTTLTYDIDTLTGGGVKDERFRWNVKVDAGDAPQGTATMRASFSGSTSAGLSSVDVATNVVIPAPAVDNGGLSAGRVPSTELARGEQTAVPVIVENRAPQSALTGKVVVDAPAGLAFAPQATVAGEYRDGEAGDWKRYAPLTLKNGTVSNGGRRITLDLDATTGRYEPGEQYRWQVLVDTPSGTSVENASIAWSVVGRATAGEFDVTGASPVVVNRAVAPLVIESPADGSTVETDSKRVVFSGTGEPGALVQVRTQTASPRTIIDTYVGADGRWSQLGGDLNFDVDYTLATVYTPRDGDPIPGTHQVTLKDTASVVQPFAFTTPANDSIVIAPDKQVRLAGTGTTGTTVTIWNYRSKDRVVGFTTVGKDGSWVIPGVLNNAPTKYELHVEYTAPGQLVRSLTHTITVKAEASTDRPFTMGVPVEGSTVTLSNFRPSDRNGEAVVSGEGTTGGVVKVWNYYTKDRIITKGGELTVDEDGKWSGTAEFRDQEYKIFVEYYAPGADTDGTPTQSFSRTFTAVAPTGK